MDSFKNTFIAVGLLGLSFVFYHFSSGQNSKIEESADVKMTSLADHETGQSNDMMANEPLGDSSDVAPMLSVDTNEPSDLELDFGDSSPTPEQTPDLQLPVNLPSTDANDFAAPKLAGTNSAPPLKPQTSPTNDFELAPKLGSPPVMDRQLDPMPSDPVKRDEGLMQALDLQQNKTNRNANTRPASVNLEGNGFAAPLEPVSTSAPARPNFQSVWPMVNDLVEQNKLRESLALLTEFYHDPNLTGPQKQRLYGWLDGLAAKVIFSAEHRMAVNPYKANGEETLEQIAAKWNLPAKLVYNVNQKAIGTFLPSMPLPAGTTLKKIPGPFQAKISAADQTMTLFVNDLYAGRFPVRIGIAGQPTPGTYRVVMKSAQGATWIDADGKEFPPSSPYNGYGPNFVGLEKGLCIHAVGDDKKSGHFGCIGLSPQDAQDIFSILSVGSTVTLVE